MKRRNKRSVTGFSLVELMIALALGSVVTAGVVQLFVANSETHTLLIGQSRMQESARFALDFVGRQVRQAGYRGCFSGNVNLHTSMGPPVPNDPPFIPYEFDLRRGIEGFNGEGIGSWNPPLDVLPNTAADFVMTNPLNTVFKTTYNYGADAGIDLDEVVSGTDVVTFRHISQIDARLGGYSDPGGTTIYGTMPTSTEPMVVGVQAGWAEFDLDHLAMVHDCEKATVFRVTTANPWGRNGDGSPMAAPTARDLTVGHDTGDPDTTQNVFDRLALLNTFEVDASVSAIESHTFFIAPGEGVNNAGNSPLSLWRKSGVQPPIELIEGVEDLQLLYGIDTDEDGVPNQYFSAKFVVPNDWTNVATVRVSIVVNSIENVGSTTSLPTHGCTIQDCIAGEAYDGLIRRSFTQTIMMRNSG